MSKRSKISRKKILENLEKKAFVDERLSLTAKEIELLSSASAQERQEARAFAEAVTSKNTEELIAEEDSKIESLLSQKG